MIDIIMPTLFPNSQEGMYYTIEQALKSNAVSNIIVINNSQDQKIGLDHPKIKIIYNQKNHYVNASWNQGIANCNSDLYAILNDDIYVNSYIFDICEESFEADNTLSLLTFEEDSEMEIDTYKNLIHTEPRFSFKIQKHFRFSRSLNGVIGSFFCGKVNEWRNIPSNLKIWFGDYYIYEKLRSESKKILQCNQSFLHPHKGTTVKQQSMQEDFKKIKDQDLNQWNKIIL